MLKILKHLKPWTGSVVIILVLTFFQVIADLALPTYMSDIIDKGVITGDTAMILSTGLRMLAVAGAGALCAVVATFLASRVSSFYGASLREKTFARVSSWSLQEFDGFGPATLITRSTNDVTQIQNVVMMMLRLMLMAPMMAIGGLFMAFREDRELSLVLAVAIPVLFILIAIVARKGLPFFRVIQEKIDQLNLVLREGLTGMRVIRAFNRQSSEAGRFDEANRDLTKTYITVNRIMAFMMPAVMLIMNLTSLAILWFGVIRIDSGGMQLGSLMAFTQYAMQIMFSLMMATMVFIMVPRAQSAAVRVNEILDTETSIADPDHRMKPGSVEDLAAHVDRLTASAANVEFRDVRFRYKGAEEYALDGISFKAGPGEVTAIIGSTGSGKSTLLKLIPRFYDVESGSILVGGRDLRSMPQAELRSRLGYVPQRAMLFSGSIDQNLRFGAPKADEEGVKAAAAIAQASSFIETMEGGYSHAIAQGGANVSGGQKQRLSIARALARKPAIYLFDDSFSALDFKTDAALRAALRKETKDATVLIVAQRVGTVMDADRIIVLEDGRVAGMGTHKELLATCTVYREIAESQLDAEALA